MARKKRKKAEQVATPPNSPLMAGAAPPVPPVALLIDGENATIPDLIAHILVEAGRMGGVTVRQVYGNWGAPSMQSWKKHQLHYALEPMGNRPGHNATDIALVIGPLAVSKALKEASSKFLSIDQLLPQAASQLPSTLTIPFPQSSELSVLLTQAYHVVASEEWD